MTAANILIATPAETTSPFSGAFLLEDGASLADAIRAGDWLGGALDGLGAVVDTAAAVADPLGTLLANGLGWLLDHLQPLAGWLDELTGDADEVAAFSQTWSNVARALDASGDELLRIVQRDLDAASGRAVEAYRAFQHDAAAHLHGAADWADALANGMTAAATIVQLVHDVVRDGLAQLVGTAISSAAEAALTLGIAAPAIVSQVATRVASLAVRLGRTLTELIASVRRLQDLLDALTGLFDRARRRFDDILAWSGPPGALLAVPGNGVPRHLRDLDFTPGAPGPGVRGLADDPIVWRNETEGVSLTASQKRLADEYLARVREREPAITAAIVAVAEACGIGKLAGLDDRLKTAESFYRKFATHLARRHNQSTGAAETYLRRANDTVRFTFTIDEADYAAGTRDIAAKLAAGGFAPTDRVRNSWGGEGYQGINSTWIHRDTGQFLEVQFHTPMSLWATKASHPLYDEIRAPGTPPESLPALRAAHDGLFARVTLPSGAADIDLARED